MTWPGASPSTAKPFAGSSVDQYDFGVFITKAEGVSEADAEQAIAAVAKQYPNGELQSRTDYINTQAQGIQQVVNIIYLLLALSVIIAAVGIVITLVLSVFERRREPAGARRGHDQTSGALQRPLGVGDHGRAGTVQGRRGRPSLGYAVVGRPAQPGPLHVRSRGA